MKVIKASPLATIQDFGRYGFRQYGIPQSGAMDKQWMIAANIALGNPEYFPVIEFAIAGLILEVEEKTSVSVVGASIQVNGKTHTSRRASLSKGDVLEIFKPTHVYAYLAIGGLLEAQQNFGSYSTYIRANFGGIEGRILKKGDVLISTNAPNSPNENEKKGIPKRLQDKLVEIRIMKGPEWDILKEFPEAKTFKIDAASDRMGIRLIGAKLEAEFREITSSAVVPGTIQLPSSGQPIILMNDCQTTGGYPRIGKVLDEDLGKLGQTSRFIKLKHIF